MRKIFVNYTSGKGLILKTHKELKELQRAPYVNKKTIHLSNELKHEQVTFRITGYQGNVN